MESWTELYLVKSRSEWYPVQSQLEVLQVAYWPDSRFSSHWWIGCPRLGLSLTRSLRRAVDSATTCPAAATLDWPQRFWIFAWAWSSSWRSVIHIYEPGNRREKVCSPAPRSHPKWSAPSVCAELVPTHYHKFPANLYCPFFRLELNYVNAFSSQDDYSKKFLNNRFSF